MESDIVKKYNRILLCLTVFVIAVMTGCMGAEQAETAPTATPGQPKQKTMETLAIYSINSDTMTLIPVSVKKDAMELSPYNVAYLVLHNLNEEDIELDDVYQEDKRVIVSFGANGKPLKNCGPKMETLILEAFANSLLDNVENCEQVVFRCEGKEYKSSQYSFGKNEVFASD